METNLGGPDGKVIHGGGAADAVEIVNPSQNQLPNGAVRYKTMTDFWNHMDKEYLD